MTTNKRKLNGNDKSSVISFPIHLFSQCAALLDLNIFPTEHIHINQWHDITDAVSLTVYRY